MKEFFKEQLEYANPLTQEILDEMEKKRYFSGEDKKAGDIILYGFKVSFDGDDETDLQLTLFDLCEREFEYYQDQYIINSDPFKSAMNIPLFIPKGEEDKYNELQNISK